jgi:hypothetical protein
MSKQQIIQNEKLPEIAEQIFATTRIELSNRAGKRIVAYLDVPKAAVPAG